MVLNLIKDELNRKLEKIGKDPFLGYVLTGSRAKGTGTEESDYDFMILTTPEEFELASTRLSYAFEQVNEHYFKGSEDFKSAEDLEILLSPAPQTKDYSVNPQTVRELGGEVFRDWKPIPLPEALKFSSIARDVLHVLWSKGVNLDKKASEIRRLKNFMKKIKVEIVGGFQSELLVNYLGSFDNVIKRVATDEPIVYDFHGRPTEELRRNRAFTNDYFIITDPIDPSRNAFGAITNDTKFMWDKMVYSSRVFLETGNIEPRPLPSGNNYAIRYDVSRFLDESSKFTKLFGVGNECRNILKNERYGVDVVDVDVGEELVFLNLEDDSRIFWHVGPPKTLKEACEIFEKKYKGGGIVEKEGRLFVQRERPNVKDILEENGFEVVKF